MVERSRIEPMRDPKPPVEHDYRAFGRAAFEFATHPIRTINSFLGDMAIAIGGLDSIDGATAQRSLTVNGKHDRNQPIQRPHID